MKLQGGGGGGATKAVLKENLAGGFALHDGAVSENCRN